jgi:hypothetical protein
MIGDSVYDWAGRNLKLRPGTFWHLMPAGGVIRNNARIGKGVVYSINAIARETGLSGFTTERSHGKANDPKEVLWEVVRERSYGQLPSRFKSLYCFESNELASRAALEWFPEQHRLLLEMRIAETAAFHRCDAQLLETPQSEWEDSAERYWRGEMSDKPFPEIIVDGPVYFTNWAQFPLGF